MAILTDNFIDKLILFSTKAEEMKVPTLGAVRGREIGGSSVNMPMYMADRARALVDSPYVASMGMSAINAARLAGVTQDPYETLSDRDEDILDYVMDTMAAEIAEAKFAHDVVRYLRSQTESKPTETTQLPS